MVVHPNQAIIRGVALILAIALITKDASHLNDRFIMRGIAQGLCLLVGYAGFLHIASFKVFRRYQFFFLFLFVGLVSSLFSEYVSYSLLQVLSLFSIFLFGIVSAESQQGSLTVTQTLFEATLLCYLVVCTVSVGLWQIAPHLVFQSEVAGGSRFSGLFSRPAMMGSAAGILVGISLFGNTRFKYGALNVSVLGLVSGLICLALTGSRTFWVAGLVAYPVVLISYFKERAWWYEIVSVLAVVFVLAAVVWDVKISEKELEQIQLLRYESIKNLTGRKEIWAEAFRMFEDRPFLGYGLAAGGMEFVTDPKHATLNTPRNIPTLHNGYIQSLVDLGVFGALLYCIIIIIAVLKVLRLDRTKEHGAVSFILIYLAVANIGESTIFTASTFHSVLFWYLAIFAFSLPNKAPTER